MNIEQLQYLCMVAKTNSITAAAEQLFATQQAISKSISKLEKELNVQLLTRSYKGVQLTPAGEKFVQQADPIVTHFENLYFFMREKEITTTLSGNLYLYCAPYFMYTIIPNLMVNFHRLYPEVTVNIDQKLVKDIVAEVGTQKANIGFIAIVNQNTGVGTLQSYQDMLNWEFLAQDRLLAYVSNSHPLAKKHHISVKELDKQPVIFGDCPGLACNLREEYQITPEVLINSSNAHVHNRMVAETNIIGFTTERIIQLNDVTDCSVLEIAEKPRLNIIAIWPKEHTLTPLEKRWIEEVTRVYSP